MNKIIAQTTLETEMVNKLLARQVPTYRQAYSDRTSWLMSCFSELAYLRFNPLFKNQSQEEIITKLLEEFAEKTKKSSLLKLLDIVGYDHKEELKKLTSELQSLNASLAETFDANGTQAILVDTDKFIALAFRGTEVTSLKDIKTNAEVMAVKCDGGGMVHSGFIQAFNEVATEIAHKLNQERFQSKPLFITGHSLGGALATIAAKRLRHSAGIAACYTFGSPRVGDAVWVSNIKTPLYRIVNAADCVTMLPPGSNAISLIGWLSGFIPYFGKGIKDFLSSKFAGYLHGGNMRYLTNCIGGNYQAVKLLYPVSFFYRIKMLYVKARPLNKPLADHSISVYRRKLAIVATNRE